jgi:uncharacterized damage-inducible protein DinB
VIAPPAVLDPAAAGTFALPPSIVAALRAELRSLRAVVAAVPEDAYRATPRRSSGSIGEQVRHSLDHVRALVESADRSSLSYDRRARGTRIETHPHAAADEIVALLVGLQALDDGPLDRTLWLRMIPSRGESAVDVRTTMEREVAFVVQHLIHHAAIIALLFEDLGCPVPPHFGLAPSTPSRG